MTHRYERKFPIHGESSESMRRFVERHPFGFRVQYPAREVHSVYLDTPNLGDYRDHVDGAAIRRKYRVRWYGPRIGRVERPILEVKGRDGPVGTKVLCALEPLEFDGDLPHDRIRVRADASLSADHRGRLACSIPVSTTGYMRHYYLSASGHFRLTIDEAIHYGAVGPRFGHRRVHDERGLIVVEVKYDVVDDDEVQAMTCLFPFRLGKYSKYVASVERLAAGPV